MALGDKNEPFEMKQGDTRPHLEIDAWQGSTATPVPMTDADVVFNMKPEKSGTLVVNRQAATIVDDEAGILRYTFKTSETSAAAGLYVGEFEVTFADGGILTFPPGKKYIYIELGDDIA